MFNQINKMIKSVFFYFLGNVSSNLLSFILLPVYTSYLSTSEYGQYDVIRTYITFFSTIIFMQIPTVVLRYMYDYKNKKIPITNAFFIFILSSILSFLIIFIGCNINNVQYAFVIALFSLSESSSGFYGYISRGMGGNKLFALSGVVSTLANAITNIMLLIIFDFSYSALFISYIVGTACQCILIEFNIHPLRMINVKLLSKKIIFDMYKFAFPFSLNIGAYWFLNSYSRIIISSNLGVEENGIYAVATKFTVALNLLSSCIMMAWQELAFEKGASLKDKKEIARYYSNANKFYILAMLFSTIGVITVIKIIFPFMINGEFLNGEKIVPIAVIATLLNIYSSFLTSIFSALKKNNILFLSTLIGAIVNIILANILIENYYVLGVTFANVVGFLINVLIRLYILKIKIDMKIYNRLMYIPFLGVIISLIIYYTASYIINLVWLFIMIIAILSIGYYFLISKGVLKNVKKNRFNHDA